MKRPYAGVLALLFLTSVVLCVQAEDRRPDKEGMPGKKCEQRLKMLTEKLGLSAAQVEKVKAVLDDQDQKTKTAFEEFAAKQKTIRKQADAAIEAQLTAEQKVTYEELAKARPEKPGNQSFGRGERPEGDAPPPPPGAEN
ncbi:MAG: hypothetical protein WC859_07120 [Elusimicrobiota bacterium]|jgi:hypothetical protein